jgi:hypothetical protein
LHLSSVIVDLLNFGLDDKGHVTKGKADVLVHQDPVMVYLVESVALLEPNLRAKDVLVLLSKVFNMVTLQGAVLLRQRRLVFLDDLEITLLVPDYLVLLRYLIGIVLCIYLQTP